MVDKVKPKELRENVRTLITELAKKKKLSKPLRDALLYVLDAGFQFLLPQPLPEGQRFTLPRMPSHFEMSGPWSVLSGSANGVRLINLGKLMKESGKIEVKIDDIEGSFVEFSIGDGVIETFDGKEADEIINDLKAVGSPIALSEEEAEHLYNKKAAAGDAGQSQ